MSTAVAQVAHLRQVETNPANYHAAVSGFLAEIDRMQLEVREYLSSHPTEVVITREMSESELYSEKETCLNR